MHAQDRRDGVRPFAHQRDFDEDQRLVDQRRMKERIAAPVGRIDAPAQIVPIVDLVHRLVADDLFQHDRGRCPVDAAQHQEAAVEPGREQVHEIGVDRREVVAMCQRIEQLLAHGDQRLGAARREIEPAQQFLTARLGGGMQLGRGGIVRLRPPGLDRRLDAGIVRPESGRQRLEEGDPRPGGQIGIAHQNLARERDAGGFAPAGQQLLAQFDQVFGALRGFVVAAAPALDQRAAPLGNRLQQFAEERRVHRRPITASASQVAIPGNKHSKTTAKIIRPTNGSTPQITSRNGMSGAIFLITNRLSPTGG